MCRPRYYTVAYEINPWMSLKRKPSRSRASLQWEQLYRTLTKKLHIPVRLVPPQPGLPDLVFTANAGLVRGRSVIRSNFRFPQRQREEPVMERYFRQAGLRVVTLDHRYSFEGEGDALWMGRTLVFGFRFRSDAAAHQQLARVLKARVLAVELVDRRFYHLDTCFCPLTPKSALWFPRAFDRYARKVLRDLVPELLAVSEADALRFACNSIIAGSHIVMPSGISASLKNRLKRRGFAILPVDLSEFLKAGGSAKCLVLNL